MTTEIDGLFVCPYNRFHMVEWHKLPNHLVRCRNNNAALREVICICPYNQCHHVPKTEMESHLKSCKDHHTFKAASVKPAPCESLPQTLGPRKFLQEEEEHLRYMSHRNSFTKKASMKSKFHNGCPESSSSNNTSADTDAYALKQQQMNMDDLDEWFRE